MIPKLIHHRTAASAFVLALILLSSSFSIATISSVGRQSTGSHAPPSQATFVTQNIGNIKELLQISTNNLYTSVPQSAYAIGVPVTAFYNDRSGYVDFLGGWAPSLLAFDTKTNLVHSVQILTETSPGTLISESLDPKNGELYVLDGNIANYYSLTTGARVFALRASNYTLLKILNLGNGTFGMAEAYDSRSNQVYIGLANHANYQDVLSVIDPSTDTVVRNVPLNMNGTGPNNYPVLQSMVYDPNNDLLYIVRTLLGLANGGFPYAGPSTTGGTSDLVIVNATTGLTVAAIPLIEPAMGVTYDPANSNVYVTLQGAAGYGPAVAVVDTRSNSLVGLIPLPSSSPGAQSFVFLTFISIPRLAGITYDPGNGYLYIGTINSNSVFVINGATNSLVTTIQSPPPDYNPESIAYDPVNGILYVSAETGVGIAINGSTNQIVGTYALQGFPADALYDPLNGDVYVNSIDQGSVYVVSSGTGRVVATVWPGDPYYKLPIAYGSSMALDPANGMVYITDPDMSMVSVIDGRTNQIVHSIVLPSDVNTTAVPDGIVFDPSNGKLYVTLVDCNTSVAGAVTVGDGTINLCGQFGNAVSANVAVVDPVSNIVVGSIKVGVFPEGIVYDQANGSLYVATYNGTSSIQVIDATRNVRALTIDLGSYNNLYITSMTYDSANGNLYAYATGASPSILVVSTMTNTLVGAINIVSNPYTLAGLAYNPVNQLVYTNLGGYLQAIDGNTNRVIGTLSTAQFAFGPGGGIGVDPKTGTLYAPNTSIGFVATVTTAVRLPLTISSVTLLNSQGTPQSSFQTGSQFTVNTGIQSTSGTDTQFIGVVQITNANGLAIFAGTDTMSLAAEASASLTFTLALPLGLAPGSYNVTVSAWNGFPATMGTNWKALATPQTVLFTISS